MASIMTIRAPEELQKALKEAAERQGFTRNSLVLQILREWVKKNA